MRLKVLKVVLVVVGLIQVVFGLGYLLIPSMFNQMMGYAPVPPWTDFISRFGGVRFLAMAIGMWLAFRDPIKNISWIKVMIFVQAVDFLAALYTVLSGTLPVAKVNVALVLPLLWTILLTVFYPKAAK